MPVLYHIRVVALRISRPGPTSLHTILLVFPSSLLLQPYPLLLFQPSLRRVLLFRQLLPLDEKRDDDPQRRERRVEDPQDLQTVRVCDVYGIFLFLWKRAEEVCGAAEGATSEAAG